MEITSQPITKQLWIVPSEANISVTKNRAGRLALWKSVSEKTMFKEAGLCKSFIGKADSERRWSTHWEEDKADTNRQDSVAGPKVCDKGGGVAIKF